MTRYEVLWQKAWDWLRNYLTEGRHHVAAFRGPEALPQPPEMVMVADLWQRAFGVSFFLFDTEDPYYDHHHGPLEEICQDKTALTQLYLLLGPED